MKKIGSIFFCAFTLLAILATVCPTGAFAAEGNMSVDGFIVLCGEGTPQQIEEAIRAGADVNAKNALGWTPLMQAARFGNNPEVLSVLIKAGADVDAKNNRGETALDLAKGKPEFESILEAKDTKPMTATSEDDSVIASSVDTPEAPEPPKAPEKTAPHAFLPKARIALTQFEHFSIEVPDGWSVNDDKANNTVTFTAPGGSAGFTLSVTDGQGAPLERWAHLLMFLKQGQNIAQSGDVYTFEFEAEGAAFRAAVTGGKFIGTMAITGEHEGIGRMIKSLSPSPAINSINFNALHAALAGKEQ